MANRIARGSPAVGGPAGDGEAFASWARSTGMAELAGANRVMEVDRDHGYFVARGVVDLFAQSQMPEGPGRRRPLGTIGSGRLIWTAGGIDLPEGWRLLAVGHPGTELIRLDTVALQSYPGAAALAAEVATLAAAVGKPDGPRGKPDDAGDPLEHAREALGQVVGGAITESLVNDVVQAERIGGEAQREHHLLDASLSDLVDVVDRKHPIGTAPDNQLQQLELVLTRLGDELGVDLASAGPLDENARDVVTAALTTAGCRARVTVLREGWWREAGFPLLGFVADGRRPVALLPRRGTYLVFDPAEGTTRPLRAELAAQIASHAYTIYPPLPTFRSVPRLLRACLGGSGRKDMGVLLALGTLAGLITLLIPLATDTIFSNTLPNESQRGLIEIALLLTGATITWGLVALSQNLSLVRISGRLEARLDPGLMDRLLLLPTEFFRRYSTGDLATRANGLQIIRQQLSGAVVTTFLSMVFSSFNVVLMFVYSPTLGLVALGTLLVVVSALVLLNLRIVGHQRLAYEHTGEVAAELFQVLNGVGKMRIAHAETRLMARWAWGFRRQQEQTYAVGRLQAWVSAAITALPAVIALVLFATTGYVLNRNISGGTYMAVVTSLGQFTAALAAMTLTLGPLLSVIPLWQRILPIIDAQPEEVGERDPGVLSGQISVRSASFSYNPEAEPVLRDVSIEIAPGEMVALTGTSGSGKSTLLRLLLGLDQPTKGAVLYDGRDLRSLDGRAVRQQCGVVMQNARPLPGEILSTILGDSPGGEEDAWDAARAAGLADDIALMPMKMHTIIGEGGLAFSGGQVQRMMIARALAHRPRILFFDEATSALDDRIQAQVSARIDEMNVTRIVIAHRLSTIRHADRIYVLDAGRVVEAGTFDELMELGGTFRQLATRQLL